MEILGAYLLGGFLTSLTWTIIEKEQDPLNVMLVFVLWPIFVLAGVLIVVGHGILTLGRVIRAII